MFLLKVILKYHIIIGTASERFNVQKNVTVLMQLLKAVPEKKA